MSTVATLSTKDLKALVAADEHNEFEDEETHEWLHAYWDCAVCDAEKEIEARRHRKEAKKPGRCSAIYIPGVQLAVAKNVAARELRTGMQARYLSRPGVSDYPYEYAEALTVARRKDGKIEVEWRKTNSPTGPSFTAVYGPDEDLRVTYTMPLGTSETI